MEAYVIIAEVTVLAERLDEFLTHSLDDARNSVANGAGLPAVRRKCVGRGLTHRRVLRGLRRPRCVRGAPADATFLPLARRHARPHHFDPDHLPAPPLIYGRRQKAPNSLPANGERKGTHNVRAPRALRQGPARLPARTHHKGDPAAPILAVHEPRRPSWPVVSAP